MHRTPNRITVDLRALTENLRQITGLLNGQTQVVGVVKSDAYGHGLVPVSRILVQKGVSALGVAHVGEGLALRDAGIRIPVMVLCGLSTAEECVAAVRKGLIPVIYDLSVAEILNSAADRCRKQAPVYLKIDTGMGRLGIAHDHIGEFLDRLTTYTHLNVKGMTSHLSTADEPGSPFVGEQRSHFETALAVGRSKGFALKWNSMANSAGLVADGGVHFDSVRCGILLYGGFPSPDFACPVPLRSVMRFTARVLQVRRLDAGTPVSYGRTYYTPGERNVAVISAGYGDGIPRRLSNEGYVLIRGKKAPMIGRICMNLTVCDVTRIRGVRAGDEAVILGAQGEEMIRADDIARWADTISYEVFCTIGQMNQREYHQ